MNRLYKTFNDELTKSSQAWQKIHTDLIEGTDKPRDKLVFEEQQLEKHINRLIAHYQQTLYDSDIRKTQQVT